MFLTNITKNYNKTENVLLPLRLFYTVCIKVIDIASLLPYFLSFNVGLKFKVNFKVNFSSEGHFRNLSSELNLEKDFFLK